MSCCGQTTPTNISNPTPVNATCCPVVCAQVETTGVGDTTVPEFDLTIADEQLVELTVTGYITQETMGVPSEDHTGFIYMRIIARRNDANGPFDILNDDFTLQIVPAGISILAITDGVDLLQIQLTSTTGTWFWDLSMCYCIRDKIITVVAG